MPKFPPPILPLICLLIGVGVHFTLWEENLLPNVLNLVLGGVFLIVALLLAWSAHRAFARQGESLDIGEPTGNLVSGSVYRFSRNPVYLVMLLLILAIGSAINSASTIAAVAPAFIALNWYTIPREERYLHRKLGAEYEAYKSRVRRWI